jgi:hypothetical protein
MAERTGRRGWMVALGSLLLVVLLATAAALWIAAGDRRADNVAGFARAPVGCDTTLDFESTGTFVLYVETSGELDDDLAGACDAQQRYDRDADDIPQVELVLRDADGDEVELRDTGEVGYDVDGFVGSAVHEVQIDTPGDHVLTVAPSGGDAFAIAVGRTPDQGVALLRWGAVAAAIGGWSSEVCSSCSEAGARQRRSLRRLRGRPTSVGGPRVHPGFPCRHRRPARPALAGRRRPTPAVAVGAAVAASVAAHHRDDLAVDLHLVGGELHRLHRGVGGVRVTSAPERL